MAEEYLSPPALKTLPYGLPLTSSLSCTIRKEGNLMSQIWMSSHFESKRCITKQKVLTDVGEQLTW